MAQRRFMNARGTAEYLDVAEQTLSNWRYLGKGPRFYRVGSRIRYDVADVDRWLEEHADDREPAA